MRAHYKGT